MSKTIPLAEEIKSLSEARSETQVLRHKLAAITKVARTRPQDLLPQVEDIATLLDSASNMVRTGSLETLLLISRTAPGAVAYVLPKLHKLLANDPQNALGARAIEILTNYGKTSTRAAQEVIAIFSSTVNRLGVRNAVKVLKGLAQVVKQVPGLTQAALRIGQGYEKSLARSLRAAGLKLRSIAAAD